MPLFQISAKNHCLWNETQPTISIRISAIFNFKTASSDSSSGALLKQSSNTARISIPTIDEVNGEITHTGDGESLTDTVPRSSHSHSGNSDIPFSANENQETSGSLVDDLEDGDDSDADFIKKYESIHQRGLFSVPYSDHSNFDELQQTVDLIKPRSVLPLVKDTSWIASKAEFSDMSCFDHLLYRDNVYDSSSSNINSPSNLPMDVDSAFQVDYSLKQLNSQVLEHLDNNCESTADLCEATNTSSIRKYHCGDRSNNNATAIDLDGENTASFGKNTPIFKIPSPVKLFMSDNCGSINSLPRTTSERRKQNRQPAYLKNQSTKKGVQYIDID